MSSSSPKPPAKPAPANVFNVKIVMGGKPVKTTVPPSSSGCCVKKK